MEHLIPFTTSGSLVDCVDKKMLVVLRDGRKLTGVLRSYDQFANLVLENTVERVFYKNAYSTIQQGLFLIRGENVVLLGEVDLDEEDDVPLQSVPPDKFYILDEHAKAEAAARKKRDAVKARVLYEQKGFCKEGGEGDWY